MWLAFCLPLVSAQSPAVGKVANLQLKPQARHSTIRCCYKPGSSSFDLIESYHVVSCIEDLCKKCQRKSRLANTLEKDIIRRTVILPMGYLLRFPRLLQAGCDGKLSASSEGVIPPQPAWTVGCEVPFDRFHHNTPRTLLTVQTHLSLPSPCMKLPYRKPSISNEIIILQSSMGSQTTCIYMYIV